MTASIDKFTEILLDLMIRHRYVLVTHDGKYRFVCDYNKDFEDGFHACPNNKNGVCQIVHNEIPWFFVHKYNGRKMWKCPCG